MSHRSPPSGILRTDSAERAVYSRAACIYKRTPAGVLFPKGPEDLAWALRHCRALGLSLTLRGGGSGLAGQTVGEGLVADVSRLMNKIVELRPEALEAEVQPGVVCSDLNRAAAPLGLRFAPDPSSADFCTFGGMLADNSKGPHSVKYGTTLHHVKSLKVLLADGSEVVLDRGFRSPEAYPHGALQKVASIIQTNRRRISERWPRSRTNASGYNLRDCIGDGGVDLVPLFIGSEGTLGIFLEATLSLSPLPRGLSLALLEFSDVASAGRAVLDILPKGPSACEILDNTFLDIIRGGIGAFPLPVDDSTRCLLILESDGGSKDEAEAGMDALLEAARASGPSVVRRARDASERAAIWAFRKAASPLLNHGRGTLKSVRFIEDGAVPTEGIPAYLKGVSDILASRSIDVVIFGHAGDGNFHVNPFINLKDRRHFEQVPLIAKETAELLASLSGTLSGEHGDGRLRTPFLPLVYGDLTGLFREIKLALDPEEILNPGVIAPAKAEPMERGIRFTPDYSPASLPGRLSREPWLTEAERCHGCGTCRDFCPTAQASDHDLLSSRGRGYLLQALLAGELDPSEARRPEVRTIFDSCLGCSLCALNCPTGVDIAPLAAAFREAFTPQLQKLRDAFLGSVPSLGYKLGPSMGRLSGRLENAAPFRIASAALLGLRTDLKAPVMAKAFGFEQGRLYLFEAPKNGNGKAAYFYGCYGNTYNPAGEARQAVEVLNALGADVVVPPQACCGVSAMARGLLDGAAQDAAFTRRNFLPWIEKGYTVVASSPSCLLALSKEHPRFFPGDEADKFARACQGLFSYIRVLLERAPRALKEVPLRAVYQTPCHGAVLGADADEVAVLRRIPGLELLDVTKECCGMAGSHGAEARHAELSETIAENLYSRIRKSAPDAVVTSCGSCAVQNAAHLAIPVYHPLEILAKALEIVRSKE